MLSLITRSLPSRRLAGFLLPFSGTVFPNRELQNRISPPLCFLGTLPVRSHLFTYDPHHLPVKWDQWENLWFAEGNWGTDQFCLQFPSNFMNLLASNVASEQNTMYYGRSSVTSTSFTSSALHPPFLVPPNFVGRNSYVMLIGKAMESK